MESQSVLSQYLPVAIQALLGAGFVVTTLFVTHKIGPKKRTKNKLEIFEAGLPAVGNARMPFSIKYFLTAILFVLFDVEVIFMYPWAVTYKTLGLVGFLSMGIFLTIFMLGFFYIIKKGALKWE